MMYKVVQNLALAAALLALVASLWQDWSLITTVKRMLVGYLVFFFLGALMALTVKLVGVLEKDQSSAANEAHKEPTD